MLTTFGKNYELLESNVIKDMKNYSSDALTSVIFLQVFGPLGIFVDILFSYQSSTKLVKYQKYIKGIIISHKGKIVIKNAVHISRVFFICCKVST